MTVEPRSLAQVAYEAYADFTGYKSLITGNDLPDWSDLSDALRGAWGMAAEAVVREIQEHDILPETLTSHTPDDESEAIADEIERAIDDKVTGAADPDVKGPPDGER